MPVAIVFSIYRGRLVRLGRIKSSYECALIPRLILGFSRCRNLRSALVLSRLWFWHIVKCLFHHTPALGEAVEQEKIGEHEMAVVAEFNAG